MSRMPLQCPLSCSPVDSEHLMIMQNGGVAAVTVNGKFVFDAANHRDFLGACLGTGIERSKVGDILVTGETGAYIMIAPELVKHLEATLTQVSCRSQLDSQQAADSCLDERDIYWVYHAPAVLGQDYQDIESLYTHNHCIAQCSGFSGAAKCINCAVSYFTS